MLSDVHVVVRRESENTTLASAWIHNGFKKSFIELCTNRWDDSSLDIPSFSCKIMFFFAFAQTSFSDSSPIWMRSFAHAFLSFFFLMSSIPKIVGNWVSLLNHIQTIVFVVEDPCSVLIWLKLLCCWCWCGTNFWSLRWSPKLRSLCAMGMYIVVCEPTVRTITNTWRWPSESFAWFFQGRAGIIANGTTTTQFDLLDFIFSAPFSGILLFFKSFTHSGAHFRFSVADFLFCISLCWICFSCWFFTFFWKIFHPCRTMFSQNHINTASGHQLTLQNLCSTEHIGMRPGLVLVCSQSISINDFVHSIVSPFFTVDTRHRGSFFQFQMVVTKKPHNHNRWIESRGTQARQQAGAPQCRLQHKFCKNWDSQIKTWRTRVSDATMSFERKKLRKKKRVRNSGRKKKRVRRREEKQDEEETGRKGQENDAISNFV